MISDWLKRNEKTIIISSFVIPIIIVAVVSISHVTQWYGISNPLSWAVYLSIGIEIAALSSLAALSAGMGKNVYLPFIIVTLIQFIGNIFFSYSYIDVNSLSFKNWVELVTPIVNMVGVESTDLIGHKRFLAFFSGGILPIISLSFLHMLIKFTEKNQIEPKPEIITPKPEITEPDFVEINDEEKNTDFMYVDYETNNKQWYKNIDPKIVPETVDLTEVLNIEVPLTPIEVITPIVDNVTVEEPEMLVNLIWPTIKENNIEESVDIEPNVLISDEDIENIKVYPQIEVISPIVEEVIIEEPIIEPVVLESLNEDVMEDIIKTSVIIEPDLINGDNNNVFELSETDTIENIIIETPVIDVPVVETPIIEIQPQVPEQNFTKVSEVKPEKIVRKGTRFIPPDIKWGSR